MATWENITHSVRETLEQLAEGWQEIWQKSRGAITHFTPNHDDAAPPARSVSWGVLSAELVETADAIEVSLEAPGMESGDFDVRIEGQVLYVSGKRSYTNQRSEGHYHITERAYGSFQRALQLPCEVDEAVASANYRHGVLEISIPKSRAVRPRRITVQS
jgi:HSP20 family protein